MTADKSPSRQLLLSAIIVALIAASVFAQIWLQRIRADTRENIVLFADDLPSAILRLERSIGFAGLIHSFKNHVLRPDEPVFRQNAIAQFDRAMVELDELEALTARAGIDFDPQALRDTLVSYRQELDHATELAAQGLSPFEVDEFVRIDDSAATEALSGLLTSVQRAFRATVGQQIQTLTVVLRIIGALSIILPVVIALATLFQRRAERAHLQQIEALNETLADRNERLVQSNKSLSDFAYVASHDLRTPMRAIANHMHFLSEDHAEAFPPAAKQRLDRVEGLCRQADMMVAKLYRYAKIDQNQQRIPVDMDHVFEGVRKELLKMFEPGRVSIRKLCPLPPITGDPTECATILRHLILNGVKFNKTDHPDVTVGFLPEVEKDGVTEQDVYFVRDNGIGIDPEQHGDIFRIFNRLNHPGDFGETAGTGLAFVKKAVESHGGKVWLTSSRDSGSTFYFTVT